MGAIIFDQLKISDDGKRMYINLHVNEASYFDNIYLDKIVITTSDKVSESTPDLPPEEDYIYTTTFGATDKEANLVLQATDFNEKYQQSDMGSNLFFVYVKIKGTPAQDTPCGMDEEITVGTVFDEKLLYQKIMGFTKDLADTCCVPAAFTDFILLWNAFKAAIETEHYVPAINFYNMLFSNKNNVSTGTSKRCNCHG